MYAIGVPSKTIEKIVQIEGTPMAYTFFDQILLGFWMPRNQRGGQPAGCHSSSGICSSLRQGSGSDSCGTSDRSSCSSLSSRVELGLRVYWGSRSSSSSSSGSGSGSRPNSSSGWCKTSISSLSWSSGSGSGSARARAGEGARAQARARARTRARG